MVEEKRFGITKLRHSRLRPFSCFAAKLTDPLFYKRGFVKGIVPRRWREIVGVNLAQCCAPESLHFPHGESYGAILKIISLPGTALEIEYLSPQIIDKVNRYLGFGAVARIQIRQGILAKSPKLQRQIFVKLEEMEKKAIYDQVTGVHDINLRNHLQALGEAIILRNKSMDAVE
ncbi:hypothetical protein A1OE_290 [Candidatus Endolissoclinum faulkneri L2]|uniref:DUF721 domain-containing protein n=1 Tax=Candidatus Endolissoclinum faulkneri L2 TaxID=1193729 RepID=K7YFX7_9PROT|nr:DciA family protein [Candidatus Endolissoclinum faulkneri]AFX98490.1 hypothetical protein A1OE_290 [Candidatus Endolissoclinum faulkneri L2]